MKSRGLTDMTNCEFGIIDVQSLCTGSVILLSFNATSIPTVNLSTKFGVEPKPNITYGSCNDR
jgi:hypothetical protein